MGEKVDDKVCYKLNYIMRYKVGEKVGYNLYSRV